MFIPPRTSVALYDIEGKECFICLKCTDGDTAEGVQSTEPIGHNLSRAPRTCVSQPSLQSVHSRISDSRFWEFGATSLSRLGTHLGWRCQNLQLFWGTLWFSQSPGWVVMRVQRRQVGEEEGGWTRLGHAHWMMDRRKRKSANGVWCV